jgi:uncharacterized membrane protein
VISPDSHFLVAAVLFAIVSMSMAAQRLAVGRWLSIPLLAILGGMLMANTGILPATAPTYDFVLGYVVPVAIPLLLFKAELRRIVRETGRVLVAYIAGAVGVLSGAVCGFFLVYLGPMASTVVAVLASAFVGGSVNFLAVARALDFDDPVMLAAALTTEGVIAIIYLTLLLAAASANWLHRWFHIYPAPGAEQIVATQESPIALKVQAPDSDRSWPPLSLMVATSASVLICALGTWIAAAVGFPSFSLLFITLGAVLVANLAPGPCRSLRGDYELGTLLLYFFFATVGARVHLYAIGAAALPMLLVAVVIIVVHVSVLLVAGRLFKLTFPELLVGSNACVLGPPTAAAMAASRGWQDLVTPGLLCGMLGYVIASFLGVALFSLLS